MNSLELGMEVKDFTLKDQKDKEVSLKDLRGKKVLVSFHPLAWTSVCTDQMRALERNYDKFEDLNVVALGVSIDPQPSKAAWASVLGIDKLSILSDFTDFAKVTKNFDIFLEELNASGRANFLIDEEGKLIWKKVYPLGELPDLEEVFKAIEG